MTKDLLMGYYDSCVADRSREMKEAKTFVVLKWVMHTDSGSSLIPLYRQYMLSERVVE
ncbi:MAG: hypothetical protein P4M11_11070 [Candidatus Pacebacteria bacterium]|nr:hypothetical protein [Candidatus Paceibacterota bacterium]